MELIRFRVHARGNNKFSVYENVSIQFLLRAVFIIQQFSILKKLLYT